MKQSGAPWEGLISRAAHWSAELERGGEAFLALTLFQKMLVLISQTAKKDRDVWNWKFLFLHFNLVSDLLIIWQLIDWDNTSC